jgi:outer membrane protein
MISLKNIMSCLLLVIAVQFAYGQKTTWSLQDCIDVGLENTISLKIQKLEVKRTQKSRSTLLEEMLPRVNLFGSQSYNFGSTIDPSTNGRVSSNIQYDNFYMNAQMNLLDFSAIAKTQKTKLEIELAKADQEIIENEYKLQILDSYFQALFTQELVEIQKQQLENTRFNLNRISKEITIGSKPKSDLYDIQFSFSQEELQLIETIQLYEIQITQLFQLLNYTEIIGKEIKLENTFAESQISDNVLKNPKIKAAELAFENAKKELNVQKAQNLPILTTFYQLSSFYYKPISQSDDMVESFSNQIGNNKNQQVGLQLSIPVFNGFKNSRAISAAKIDIEKSNLKLEQERLLSEQQLEIESKNKVNYLIVEEKLAQVLQFARDSFKTTQAKFTSGTADAFSFASAKNNLLTSEYALLKSKLQSQFTLFKINLIQKNDL